jgi:cytochrome c oxidase subunit 4
MAEETHHDTHDTHHEGGGHYIPPVKFYMITLFWLMILLIVTVWAGFAQVGSATIGIVIALTIAVVKATIVILNFMHARFSSKLAWLWAGAGFFWLMIMFAFAFGDYVSRLPQESWTDKEMPPKVMTNP